MNKATGWGIGILAVATAGISGWYLKANQNQIQPPDHCTNGRCIVDPGDPPVVIHGGSFHIVTASATPPKAAFPIVVNGTNATVTQVSSSYGTVPALTGAWKVQICDDVNCSMGGVQVCSSTDGKSCGAPTGKGDSILISAVPSNTANGGKNPSFGTSEIPQQFAEETRFRINGPAHPTSLNVWNDMSNSWIPYRCGASEYTDCWVTFGRGYN